MKYISIILILVSISTAFCIEKTEKSSKNNLTVALKVLDANRIMVTVKNISDKNILAYSHVETYEKHYDYFEVEALTPDHDEMFFDFVDARDKSAPVIIKLEPGESFSHTIDYIKWTERSINKAVLKKAGFNTLPHGIKIRVKYFNAPCSSCSEYYKSIWNGTVYSEWVDF
jgi:hypothetical protein